MPINRERPNVKGKVWDLWYPHAAEVMITLKDIEEQLKTDISYCCYVDGGTFRLTIGVSDKTIAENVWRVLGHQLNSLSATWDLDLEDDEPKTRDWTIPHKADHETRETRIYTSKDMYVRRWFKRIVVPIRVDVWVPKQQ